MTCSFPEEIYKVQIYLIGDQDLLVTVRFPHTNGTLYHVSWTNVFGNHHPMSYFADAIINKKKLSLY